MTDSDDEGKTYDALLSLLEACDEEDVSQHVHDILIEKVRNSLFKARSSRLVTFSPALTPSNCNLGGDGATCPMESIFEAHLTGLQEVEAFLERLIEHDDSWVLLSDDVRSE